MFEINTFDHKDNVWPEWSWAPFGRLRGLVLVLKLFKVGEVIVVSLSPIQNSLSSKTRLGWKNKEARDFDVSYCHPPTLIYYRDSSEEVWHGEKTSSVPSRVTVI